ncbi:MAG: BrnT family toxin [Luteolibacter sp.]
MSFEWDETKEKANLAKHGVDFSTVTHAFNDEKRLIIEDAAHSSEEPRFYCIGHDGHGILTVRFTLRNQAVRVIGAGYWRKQKQAYEKANR